MVHLAQIMHLSCTNTNIISKHIEIGFNMTHIILELHRVRPNWFLSLWYIRANHAPILHQDWQYLKMDHNELILEPRHLRVPLGASNMIYDPMESVAQTMHLYCTHVNTISKWTETRFHITHFTLLLHRVCLKWFPSLWYVRRKQCTYLALILTPSPIGPKQDSTWASLPRSTIGSIQNNFWPYGTYGADRAPILHCRQHCL
jgi:hypothetical protein